MIELSRTIVLQGALASFFMNGGDAYEKSF